MSEAVNPEILRWARETAGLSLEDAAKAVGIGSAYGVSGVDRLEAFERGDDQPSRTQLLSMSQHYRRSLLIFYLRQPPAKGDRGKDFRTLSGSAPKFEPILDALIRDVRARQDLVRSVLEDEETNPLDFVGSASSDISSADLAAKISTRIGLSLTDFRATKDIGEAFKYLRRRIEATGPFVVLMGNLGSSHSNVSEEDFRGYAIADSIAPFIIINDQDAQSAWSFTALHELAHIWLGASGLSGGATEGSIEALCNDVAGRILLPEADLDPLKSIGLIGLDEQLSLISRYADRFHVSRQMVAYKLLLTGFIDQQTWAAVAGVFRQQWKDQQASGKDSKSESGPTYYVTKRHRLGPALLSVVKRSLAEGNISQTKAGRVLGVKPRNIGPLLSQGVGS